VSPKRSRQPTDATAASRCGPGRNTRLPSLRACVPGGRTGGQGWSFPSPGTTNPAKLRPEVARSQRARRHPSPARSPPVRGIGYRMPTPRSRRAGPRAFSSSTKKNLSAIAESYMAGCCPRVLPTASVVRRTRFEPPTGRPQTRGSAAAIFMKFRSFGPAPPPTTKPVFSFCFFGCAYSRWNRKGIARREEARGCNRPGPRAAGVQRGGSCQGGRSMSRPTTKLRHGRTYSRAFERAS